MIRATPAQLSLLQANAERARLPRQSRGDAPQTRIRRPKAELPENIVESKILGFLRIRGWILTRQHPGLWVPHYMFHCRADEQARPIKMHERGCADWRAERAVPGARAGLCEVIYVEMKAPGKKPNPEQKTWLENRRALGFQAEWFDSLQDDGFDDGHSFQTWYFKRFDVISSK